MKGNVEKDPEWDGEATKKTEEAKKAIVDAKNAEKVAEVKKKR